jgi:TRAP-type C4-dicarboxylate transport system permease small subunit
MTSRKLRRRKRIRGVLVSLLILAIAYLLLWFGSQLFDYEIEYYEPRDLERDLGQQEQELR